MTSDIVLIHGWGMSSNVWEGVRASFARNFRVHVVDLPGHGERKREKLGGLTELVHCLAEALPKRIAVVGWSLGGTIALSWAAARPDQVCALVLIATTPSFAARDGWFYGWPQEILESFDCELNKDDERTLSRFLSLQARGDSAGRDVLRILRNSVRRAPPSPDALRSGFEILKRADLRRHVSWLQQPALVLHGASDSVVPIAAARWLSQQLPNCEVRAFASTGHALFISQPAQFVHEAVTFLDVVSH